MDLPPTSYRAAEECAQRFLAGDWAAAQAALDEALAVDGPAAHLLLMQALLHGLAAMGTEAVENLRQLQALWGGTPAGTLAQAWLGGQSTQNSETSGEPVPTTPAIGEGYHIPDGWPQIPFPSAIRPLIYLRPAPSWETRAARAVA